MTVETGQGSLKKYMQQYVIAGRIGYAGMKGDLIKKTLDDLHDNNWDIAHILNGRVMSDAESKQLFVDAYVAHFQKNPEEARWLCNQASDVYDTSPSNVFSGLDFSVQETQGTHLHDIAIRRAMHELGLQFKGNQLMQIRGKNSEGYRFSPHVVPFHKSDEITCPIREGSWLKGSIEEFWQSSKVFMLDASYVEDSKIPKFSTFPGRSSIVEPGDLDTITLHSIESNNSILAIAEGNAWNDKSGRYHLTASFPFECVEYIPAEMFYTLLTCQLSDLNPLGYDVILRADHDIPRKALNLFKGLARRVNWPGAKEPVS